MPASIDLSQLILALEERADPLAARSVEAACSGAFWSERFGERGVRRIGEDAQHHISHLKTALQFGEPSILAKYAVWLQQVLTHRGMCSRHLVEHFEALARAIHRERLPGARLAESYLREAVAALAYESEPAHSVQAAVGSLRDSTLRRLERSGEAGAPLARDLDYLLSYLTDAVALGRPDVFAQYAGWIDGYFTRRERPPGYLTGLLRAFELSLEEMGGTVRDACRPMLSAARSRPDGSLSRV